MPSRELVQVLDADDDKPAAAPKQSDVAMKENTLNGDNAQKVTESGTANEHRKITPATTDRKNASLQTKAKQQTSLAAFFGMGGGKRKTPSTPFVKNDDVEKQAATKQKRSASYNQKESAKKAASGMGPKPNKSSQNQNVQTVTPRTSISTFSKKSAKSTPAASANAAKKSTAQAPAEKTEYRKKEFREVVLGNLTVSKSDKSVGDIAPTEQVAIDGEEMNSLLPRIPPLKSFSAKQHTRPSSQRKPTTSEVEESVSSEDHGYIGGIRSQLVRKFENSPSKNNITLIEADVDKVSKDVTHETDENSDEESMGHDQGDQDGAGEKNTSNVIQGDNEALNTVELPANVAENAVDKQGPNSMEEESISNGKSDGKTKRMVNDKSNVGANMENSSDENAEATCEETENSRVLKHTSEMGDIAKPLFAATGGSPEPESQIDESMRKDSTSSQCQKHETTHLSSSIAKPSAKNITTEPQEVGGLMSFLKAKSEVPPKSALPPPQAFEQPEDSNSNKKSPAPQEKANSAELIASRETATKSTNDAADRNVEMKDATSVVSKAIAAAGLNKDDANDDGKDLQPPLTPECQELLEKHKIMQDKYCAIAGKLVQQGSQGFDEEDFSISMPPMGELENLSTTTGFPDDVVPHLASLIEGSKKPLSELTRHACEVLNGALPSCSFSEDCVAAKIKVLAERKPYVKNPAIGAGISVSNNVSAATDIFEDASLEHVWRWEVISVEILAPAWTSKVKKARSARKKFSIHLNAVARLLAALDESIKLISKGTPPKAKLDKVVAKISKEEEKVLKHERDAEKARLIAGVNKKKEETAKQKRNEEKILQKELKKKEAEERKREKEEAKRKRELEREEAKRKKEEKEREEEVKKEREQERQRKRMMSFFGGPAKKAKKDVQAPKEIEKLVEKPESVALETSGFDADRFRSCLNSGEVVKPLFSSVTRRARDSRKRKSKLVKLNVFVSASTVESPFAAQPAFAEEREVEVRNRNKYLSFYEDLRPPYHGTWSKKSATKNLGKTPFSKEPALNYDVDSEAEWEEGDDDPGEDVDNDAGDEEEEKDEEGDTRMYNYQDGWLAQDDDLGDEDELDEEAKKLLRSRKREEGSGFVPVCIIAPADGGVPLPDRYADSNDPVVTEKIEGFSVQQAYRLAAAHDGVTFLDADIFLDAFPPALTEEKERATDTASTSQSSEPSKDDMKTIAKFIHHSNLVSKSQVVEELRNTHSSVTSSRAQGFRILDSIAEKKRHPSAKNGVYWEVKKDVLETLGLDDLKEMKLPVEESSVDQSSTGKKKSTSKKNADTDAKKSEDTRQHKPEKPKSPTVVADQGSAKKKPVVSAASANLFASFFNQKKK